MKIRTKLLSNGKYVLETRVLFFWRGVDCKSRGRFTWAPGDEFYPDCFIDDLAALKDFKLFYLSKHGK